MVYMWDENGMWDENVIIKTVADSLNILIGIVLVESNELCLLSGLF